MSIALFRTFTRMLVSLTLIFCLVSGIKAQADSANAVRAVGRSFLA